MRLASLFYLFSLMVSAQVAADGIATSVTRSVTLTADEADFSIIAGASLDATQQQVTQVLLDAGLPNLTLSGTTLGQAVVYAPNSTANPTEVLYQFSFTVPAAGLKDAAKKMEFLRTNPPDVLKSLQYSAVLNASPATVDAMRQTLLPQIFAEAQKKAQVLAAAAGLKLGPIKSVTETFYSTGAPVNWIGSSQFVGGFTSTTTGTGTQYTFLAGVSFSVAQ